MMNCFQVLLSISTCATTVWRQRQLDRVIASDLSGWALRLHLFPSQLNLSIVEALSGVT